MGRRSPTDEARNVSVLSAMSPFWLGVDAAGNFAFWNPESQTELTVSVFMSAGTDTDTRTTHSPLAEISQPGETAGPCASAQSTGNETHSLHR